MCLCACWCALCAESCEATEVCLLNTLNLYNASQCTGLFPWAENHFLAFFWLLKPIITSVYTINFVTSSKPLWNYLLTSLVPRLSPHTTTTKSKEGESLVPFQMLCHGTNIMDMSIGKFRRHSLADCLFSYSVFLKVSSLGLLKRKESPGYAVDGTYQFGGISFVTGESRTTKLYSVLTLNCTSIPGCLCHQVTSFAVIAINIIFSLLIYCCHKSRHTLVVM